MAILDETANNNDGTYNGALYQQSGVVGHSLGFDNIDDYAAFPATSSFNMGAADFTIAYWIYLTVREANKAVFNTITGKGLGYMYTAVTLYKPIYWAGTFTGSGVSVLHFNDATMANEVWHHIGVVKDDTTMRGYLNGTEVNTDTVSGSISDLTTDFEIGGRSDLTGFTINGKVDEFIIWKGKALTAAEMANYNNWNYSY